MRSNQSFAGLFSISLAAVVMAAMMGSPATATTFTDEGAANFQGNWNVPNSGLIDIVNPLATPNQVNTAEWTINTTGGGTQGTFATSGNDGEEWTKVFDHSAESSGTGPWGTGTSKVCCGPVPASVSMVSSTTHYNIVGYELTTSNDSPGRDPGTFSFQGTKNGGATWVTLDTETYPTGTNANRNETYLYMLSSGANGYNGFQFLFPNNQGGGFALSEIEVFSHTVPEPSSMILCGLGAIGLFIAARRRRKA